MRRLISITVLAIFSLVSLSVNAQRGGMGGRSSGGGFHSGGGFRSAPSGGFRSAPSGGFRSAPAAGGRVFAPAGRTFVPATGRAFAPRTFAGPRSFAPRTFAPAGTRVGFHSFGPRNTFGGFPGRTSGFVHSGSPFFFHNRFHNNFFFRGCFGCFSPFFFSGGFFIGAPFFGSPFYGYPYYGAPYYGSPYYYPSDYYSSPPPPAAASSDNSNNDAQLAAQIQQLSDQIGDLQAENYRANRAENSGGSATAKEPGVPAVFIFKDGRRLTAQNYAIAGQTLWIMDEHSARKYGMDQLDVDATQQANAANGLDLHLSGDKH